MNLPNKLTVSRLILTAFFLAALFIEFRFHFTVALVLFVTASLTDLFDGIIARRRNLITDFGKLMDPLADKVLICSAFIAFIELEWMVAWMVILIVARELAITGLRLLAASKNLVLAAERQGKNKTISQITAIMETSTGVAAEVKQLETDAKELGKTMIAMNNKLGQYIEDAKDEEDEEEEGEEEPAAADGEDK